MKIFTLVFLSSLLVVSASAYVGLVGSGTEIKIEKVFVSPIGYDDNDNVQIVVHGHLPSLCYGTLDPDFTLNRVTKTIIVRQYAARLNFPDCINDETPMAYGQGGLFTTELSLGTLETGDYKVVFDNGGRALDETKFNVGKATTDSVDEFLYAPVYSAFISDIVYESSNAEVVLSGILETSCLDLDPANIQVNKYADVIVILPRLTVLSGQDCKKIETPLQEVISIGPLVPGSYLLHIRSMTGRSINRVFKVIAKPDSRQIPRIP